MLRVVSRILESREDIAKPPVKKQMEALIAGVIPEGRAGDFNQSLMELGALVCVPNGEPKCGLCPLKELCLAHLHGTADQIPVKTRGKARKCEERTVFAVERGGAVLLSKRPDQGLLAGLYEFPTLREGFPARKALTIWESPGKRCFPWRPCLRQSISSPMWSGA